MRLTYRQQEVWTRLDDWIHIRRCGWCGTQIVWDADRQRDAEPSGICRECQTDGVALGHEVIQ